MSKFEWKELPDWRNESAYSFLDDAPLEMWAWEFLRRNPEYRDDYELVYGTNKHLAGPTIYNPPKMECETERAYISRMVRDEVAFEITTFPEQLAKKWGVKAIYSPYERLAKDNIFGQHRALPLVVNDFDDIDKYLIAHDHCDSDDHIVATSITPTDQVAIVVFDMNMPIPKQSQEIQAKLITLQEQMNKGFPEAEKHSGQVGKWKRHIRVLDALRSEPKGTYTEISKILGGNKSRRRASNKPLMVELPVMVFCQPNK